MSEHGGIDWRVVADRDGRGFRWGFAGLDELVAEWADVLTLRATLTGEVRALVPAAGARPDVVKKVTEGLATAFLRSLAGKPSLHASAVSWRRRALICIGPKGAGKSTIAASLCAANGAGLLADDIAALSVVAGQWMVAPSEASHWLIKTDSGVTEKCAHAAPVAPDALPLAWIVVLGFDAVQADPIMCPMTGAATAATLLEAVVRFDSSADLMRRELHFAHTVLLRTPMYRLVRSRATHVDSTIQTLLSTIGRPTP